MLTLIRSHKTSKWVSGIMLAGLTLSLPISCFTLTTATQKTAALPPRPIKKIVATKPAIAKTKPAETTLAADFENKNIKTISENVQAKQPAPEINLNAQTGIDTYLLARVIHAEARGEPLEGQVAVGAVLLNRLHDARFPKTLSQIIFKRGEFCTVRDGQIWMTPNQQAIKAAQLAVSGWDPTNGAVYFYNPGKTTSRWIWSRPVVQKIGRHYFAV